MNIKLAKKASGRLTLLCSIAYFVSYITRLNFAAVITAIIADGCIDKVTAGLVTTLGFITYGVGQLISGKLGDMISPKKLMFIGFILTGCMNLTIPMCKNGIAMCCVWAVNGFAQSFMWPPLVKILHTALNEDDYNKACVKVSWGGTIGTILIYVISPAVIKLFNWKTVFYITSLCAFIMSAVWMILISKIESKNSIIYITEKKEKKRCSFKVDLSILIITMLAIVLQGCLRDGVTTWVPTYVSEVFKLGSEISILTGVVIPIFGLISFQITSFFYNKMGKKPYKCSAILFVVSTICAIMLAVFNVNSIIFALAMFGLIVASMHGINLILVCFLPGIFADSENVSFLSGLLNFTTYVGSAASTYGFALISEASGWNATVISWAILSFLGLTACVVCNKKLGD